MEDIENYDQTGPVAQSKFRLCSKREPKIKIIILKMLGGEGTKNAKTLQI
jgi:hypothetical protein